MRSQAWLHTRTEGGIGEHSLFYSSRAATSSRWPVVCLSLYAQQAKVLQQELDKVGCVVQSLKECHSHGKGSKGAEKYSNSKPSLVCLLPSLQESTQPGLTALSAWRPPVTCCHSDAMSVHACALLTPCL